MIQDLTSRMSAEKPQFSSALVWLRRDLRLDDHAALYHALKSSQKVYCCFVFDQAILKPLPKADRRIEFIHTSLLELDARLQTAGSQLLALHDLASAAIPALAKALQVDAVFANHDYEPAAIERDAAVAAVLNQQGQQWLSFKDQVIFEKNEVLSQVGKPFSVFTPYKNAWLKTLTPFYLQAYPVAKYWHRLAKRDEWLKQYALPGLQSIGFTPTNLADLKIPTGASGAQNLLDDFLARIDHYHERRDFPAIKGVSYLSVHLRFGTISIRTLARAAHAHMLQGSRGAEVWLSELIWRDFYFMILFHHPRVVDHAFKPAYEAIAWEQGEHAHDLFAAWREGRTGYPLVDAAMLQLNQTGYMHNRLRMVTASFLTKDLGIDWRWGEAYFARHLNDFDLAANNGGWQWAASSGCDAQPYFRIFNPVTQSEKFDPQGKFIRRYLPQLAKLPDRFIHAPWLMKPAELKACGMVLGEHYPMPIVQHDLARQQTLARYAVVKSIKEDES